MSCWGPYCAFGVPGVDISIISGIPDDADLPSSVTSIVSAAVAYVPAVFTTAADFPTV